eukprot:Skav209345  [mRNA]  locus=scaffold241:563200:563634:+ [translate_table: standard]
MGSTGVFRSCHNILTGPSIIMALNMGFHTPQPPQLLPALPPPFGLPLLGLGLGLATATAPLLAKPWRGGMTIPVPWPLPPGNVPLPPLPYIIMVQRARRSFEARTMAAITAEPKGVRGDVLNWEQLSQESDHDDQPLTNQKRFY